MESSSRWYVVMWMEGGKKLMLCHRKYGLTSDLRFAAPSFATREEAWQACGKTGVTRAVPEREEVVMRYLIQQEIIG